MTAFCLLTTRALDRAMQQPTDPHLTSRETAAAQPHRDDPAGGGSSPGHLRTIIDNQQQLIASQADMIATLGRELARRAEELARCTAIKEEMERLVRMTERAEEEAGEQVVALQTEVLRLTEMLEGARRS